MCISRGCSGRARTRAGWPEPCDKPAALVKAEQGLIPEFRKLCGALETSSTVADLWRAN
ncbi:MAG: hypothetical protein U1E25_09225 [Methylocystis sp.]